MLRSMGSAGAPMSFSPTLTISFESYPPSAFSCLFVLSFFSLISYFIPYLLTVAMRRSLPYFRPPYFPPCRPMNLKSLPSPALRHIAPSFSRCLFFSSPLVSGFPSGLSIFEEGWPGRVRGPVFALYAMRKSSPKTRPLLMRNSGFCSFSCSCCCFFERKVVVTFGEGRTPFSSLVTFRTFHCLFGLFCPWVRKVDIVKTAV